MAFCLQPLGVRNEFVCGYTGSCVGRRQGRRLATYEIPYLEHGAPRHRISECCLQITMSSSDCLPFSLVTLDCRNSTGWCLRPYGDVSGYGVRSCRSPGFFIHACLFTDLSAVQSRSSSVSRAPATTLYFCSSPTMSLPLTHGETRLSQTGRSQPQRCPHGSPILSTSWCWISLEWNAPQGG